jgi:hypothetical protein
MTFVAQKDINCKKYAFLTCVRKRLTADLSVGSSDADSGGYGWFPFFLLETVKE